MKYYVNAGNAQGASFKVDEFRSINSAILHCRATLGEGWKVTIYKMDSDIIVKQFTIRGI